MPEPTTVPFSFAAELLRKDPELARRVEELRRRREEGGLGATPASAPSPEVPSPVATPDVTVAPKTREQRQQEILARQGAAPPDIGIPEFLPGVEPKTVEDFEPQDITDLAGKLGKQVIEAIDFYQRTVQDPLIGGAQFNFAKIIPGDQFYERRVPELMAQGMNGHDALGQARREFADEFQPWWLTLTQDIFIEPTQMFPVVGFTKLPIATAKIPTLGATVAKAAPRSRALWEVQSGISGKLFSVVSQDGKIGGHYRALAEAEKAVERANRMTTDLLESIRTPGAPEIAPEVKLRQQMRLSKARRAELNAAQHEARTERIAAAEKALNEGTGEAAWTRTLSELKGELTDIRVQPLSEIVSDAERATLNEQIRAFDAPRFFDRVRARAAIDDLWIGKIPPPSELRELEKIFPGIEESVRKVSPRDFGALALEILNIPRTLKTSFDMSAPLRQGVYFLPGHPKEWTKSFGKMVQAFFNEDIARAAEQAINTHPYKSLADDSGLSITSRFGNLSGREEAYMSRLLQRIADLPKKFIFPIAGQFVKASERAYVTFLNKLRMDVFATLGDQLLSQGKTFAQNPDDFKKLAEYINRATGRGGLGPLDKAAPILNTLLFSPRNLAGHVLLPVSLAKSTPMVRKMVARDMVAFFGTGMLIMGLLDLSGVDIIKDPRSADFGKIRRGATRLDIWGGKQPLARFLARFALKKGKSTSSGELYDLGRDESFWQFWRSKFSPTVGIGVDALTEETFLGEKLEVTAGTAGQIARSGLLPLIVDDLWEAFDEQGIGGAVTASPSFFGVGSVSFTSLRDIQNRRAEELYSLPYLQLDRLDQKAAVNAAPEVKAKLAEIQENQEALDSRSMMRDRMDRRATVQTTHEAALARSLNAPGKAKRTHIADYKSKMYVVNQTLLEDPQLQAQFSAREADQPTRDYVRNLYWSAALPWNPNSAQPDYDALDSAHQDTLGLADLLGVPREYVLRRNPNRFNDPRVEAMVSEYETDQQLLRRYWNLDDRAMNMLGLSPRQRRAWRDERDLPPIQQSPATRAVARMYSKLKEHTFALDSEVRELLIKWQYRSDPAPVTADPFASLAPLTTP